MSELNDLVVPLSALEFGPNGTARASSPTWNAAQVGGLLESVVEHFSAEQVAEGRLHIVSVTYDVSADAIANEPVTFQARIDRKTRTLIFASGSAEQSDRHILKASVVYRIA